MELNNFKQIQSLLSFDEGGDWFYHLSILLRKKDMPEAARGRNNNARCIKTYYIKNVEHLESYKNEIIKLCNNFGARAYINLNAKSFEKVAFELNTQIADRLKFKQFSHMYRLYETVVGGSSVNIGDKRWIIDIDNEEISPLMLGYLEYNCDPISKWEGDYLGFATHFNSKIIDKIRTKNGWHIITKPFNVQQFKEKYSEIDIQKNNPTVLYFNYKNEKEVC